MTSNKSNYDDQFERLLEASKQAFSAEPSPDLAHRMKQAVHHISIPEIEKIRNKKEKKFFFLQPAFAVAFIVLLATGFFIRYWSTITPVPSSPITVAILQFDVQKQLRELPSNTLISKGIQGASDQDLSSQVDRHVLNLVRYIQNSNKEQAILQYKQALLVYDQLLNDYLSKDKPQPSELLLAHASNLTAWSAHLLGRPEEGVNRARWAVQHDTDKPEYLHTLAVLLCEIGELEEAKIKLQRAVEQNRPKFQRLRQDALQTFDQDRCDIPGPQT